ncbi:unnamed protein product, partial [Rotaria sp. Silwood2]
MRFSGSRNPVGFVVSNVTAVNAIAAALRTWSSYTTPLDGITWRIGYCSGAPEINANGPFCDCNARTVLRPCDSTPRHFGGMDGTTCGAPSQSMTLSF